MQKLLFLALLGLASTVAQAQSPLTKGRGLLTGSINYHYQSNGTYSPSANSFSFAPAAGYFVADNLAIGLSLGVQTAVYVPDYVAVGSPARYRVTAFTAGPFARYYRFLGGDKFALFGQGSLGYARGRSDYGSDANLGYFSIVPGLAFFPIPRLGVEASLPGIGLSSDFNGTTTLDLGVGLQNLQLGAAYYFGK